jgi:hypothetical protein
VSPDERHAERLREREHALGDSPRKFLRTSASKGGRRKRVKRNRTHRGDVRKIARECLTTDEFRRVVR